MHATIDLDEKPPKKASEKLKGFKQLLEGQNFVKNAMLSPSAKMYLKKREMKAMRKMSEGTEADTPFTCLTETNCEKVKRKISFVEPKRVKPTKVTLVDPHSKEP